MPERENDKSFRFKVSFNFYVQVLEFAFPVFSGSLNLMTQWGAWKLRAEIIPFEPDPGNAGVGMANG